MRKHVFAGVLVFTLLLGLTPVSAQSTDSELWGIWKSTYAVEFDILQTFTPNGSWGVQFYEGITYGSYTAANGYINLDATSVYVDVSHWQKSFRYEVKGDRLFIYDFNGPVEEYYKIRTFTGFGFIPCPASVKSNLFVGAYAQVTYPDGTPSRLRSGPGISNQVIDRIAEGNVVIVTGDPVCADNYTWWPVNTSPNNPNSGDNSYTNGYMAEGADGVPYLEIVGWVDKNLLRSADWTQKEVMQSIATQTGATVYAPGMYAHVEEAGRAFGAGLTGQRLANVMTAVRTSYLIVVKRDLPNMDNPVEVVCTASTLADFGVIEKNPNDPVLVCAFLDYKDYVTIAGPIAGSLFFLSQNLLTPNTIIDPYIVDPVNNWVDSRPLTRFACWVSQGSICPP